VPRVADVLIAGLALIVASPLLLVAAIAIKLDSRGPVIYRSRRVGRDGVEFDLFKLRTMRPGSDPVGVGTPVFADDPRVTRTGAVFCAATSRSSAPARR
jgi:lipopolysaccharide/colanic/teichoic acid biosynthesis glycosyltransferase